MHMPLLRSLPHVNVLGLLIYKGQSLRLFAYQTTSQLATASHTITVSYLAMVLATLNVPTSLLIVTNLYRI